MTGLPDDLAGRILDGSPEAVVVCDPFGRVRYWNRGAERIFGFAPIEAVGVSLDVIIPRRLRERHWNGWKAVMASGETRYGEGQLLSVPALHKDGRQLSIEFSVQLLKDANGRVEWIVALIRDVTARYRRDKAVRAKLAALKAKSAIPSRAEIEGTRCQAVLIDRRSPPRST
jgi:PAS domain S-box-containing protein